MFQDQTLMKWKNLIIMYLRYVIFFRRLQYLSYLLQGILICLSTFCETERDMRKYRILIINVVTASSAIVPPAIRRFVPANCPALVRFVKDINTAAHKGIPESTAVMPKATETEKYPRHTGKPSRSPLINSLFFIIPRSSFIPFSKSLSICANILYWKIYYIDKYILIENLNICLRGYCNKVPCHSSLSVLYEIFISDQ